MTDKNIIYMAKGGLAMKDKDEYGTNVLKNNDDSHNLDYYSEIIPDMFSFNEPEDDKDRAPEDLNIKNKKNDGKAKDVDMGFNNMGLQ
jgi:hypothetical protein